MESLPLNGVGQGYGYVMYSTIIPAGSAKLIVNGVHDNGVVSFNLFFSLPSQYSLHVGGWEEHSPPFGSLSPPPPPLPQITNGCYFLPWPES